MLAIDRTLMTTPKLPSRRALLQPGSDPGLGDHGHYQEDSGRKHDGLVMEQNAQAEGHPCPGPAVVLRIPVRTKRLEIDARGIGPRAGRRAG